MNDLAKAMKALDGKKRFRAMVNGAGPAALPPAQPPAQPLDARSGRAKGFGKGFGKFIASMSMSHIP